MFVKRLIRLDSLAIILSAGILIGCGPSAEEQAATSVALTAAAATSTPTVTPTHTPTPTPTHTPTATPIPYDLSVLVAGEEDAPIIGASVVLAEIGDEVGTLITDDVGQVFWNDLPGETVNLSISAQGYYPLDVAETIERGISQITTTLERDPHGLLPSEACAPSERLLYIEDFQDGSAQGWAEIEARAQGWDVAPHPDSAGNLVALNSGVTDTQIVLRDLTFDNAVWRVRFMPHERPTNYSFIRHWVTEPYEVKDGTVDFSAYSIGAYSGQGFAAVRAASPFPEVVLLDINPFFIRDDEWHVIEMSTYFDTFEVWMDGILYSRYNDPDPLPGGQIALEYRTDESFQSIIYFDNMTVCELSAPFVPMPTPEPQP